MEGRRGSRVPGALALGLAAWAAAAGCTPGARRGVLEFLLDGVPPAEKPAPQPAAPATAVAVATAAAHSPAVDPAAPQGVPILTSLMTRDPAAGDVFHPPFQRQLCQFCHNFGAGIDRLRYPPPTLCFQCHGRVDQMGPTTHWPVRQGRCVTCHNPHQAPNKRLLRMAPPRLCFQCHNPDTLSHGPDNPQCLECHNPHSAGPRLLKSPP